MTAPQPTGFRLAVVRDGKPDWAAAEVVIPDPVAVELGDRPPIGLLFAALITAPGAPSDGWVGVATLTREENRIELEVDSRAELLAWSSFLGLTQRSEAFEQTPTRLNLLRSGRVTIAGHRVRVAVRWCVRVVEVGP